MKTVIRIYSILTYILLPIALLIGVCALFGLLASIAAPVYLLAVFMLASIVIYTFTSFSFLNKGILHHKLCKPSLKDWIKVNAYVSIAFGILSLMQTFTFFTSADFRKQIMDGITQMAAQNSAHAELSKQYTTTFVNGTVGVMLVISLILLIHIFITFRLLVAFKDIFQQAE